MAKDRRQNRNDEHPEGSTLDVVDIEEKPAYPVASLDSKKVEPHVFDSMTQVVTYIRDKLRDTPLESPEESASEVLNVLNRDLTQLERDELFKLLLVKEAHQAGLFPKKPTDMNALSDKFREGAYPYKNHYSNKLYERELYDLQVELLKLQDWVKRTKAKVIVIFEGRDAAGKGGTIRRFTENLNPRGARTVALSKPTENETGQWYFQRYCAHLPNPGEICFFDRSWYNRAVVEPVMGFCTPEQSEIFLNEVSSFEQSLIRGGTHIIKFWLAVSQEEQKRRFRERRENPLKRWKLSPVDVASMEKWDEYTKAIRRMFQMTDTAETPWTVIRNEDKRRGRLNAIRVLLQSIPYDNRDMKKVGAIDPLIVGRAGGLFASNGDPLKFDINGEIGAKN